MEMSRRQGLYRVPWGQVRPFQGEAFQAGHWWDFKSRDLVFYSAGWELGPVTMTVRVFCVESGSWGSSGEGPSHLCVSRRMFEDLERGKRREERNYVLISKIK